MIVLPSKIIKYHISKISTTQATLKRRENPWIMQNKVFYSISIDAALIVLKFQ